MDSIEQEKATIEGAIVASPMQEEFEVPKTGLQQTFDEQNQETSSAAEAPTSTNEMQVQDQIQTTAQMQEQEQEQEEVQNGLTIAKGDLSSESIRGASAGKAKGRGGGRVASTTSAKGKGRGGGAIKGGAGRGGGVVKARASTSARGGSKGGAVKGGGTSSKGGKGKGKAGKLSGGAEASGVGSVEGGNNDIGGIGSGPSNTVFPLARVSRIVKVDKEIEMTSKDAIWTIAVATELFIKHLTDSAYAKARLDKKKTITFKELAAAVESQNEFFFLQDIIPQPIAFSKALEMRQEVEERNHMREAGLFDDEEEEVEGAAPLINQTIGNETEVSNMEKAATMIEGLEEGGDTTMEENFEPPPSAAALSNGHSEAQSVLFNGNTAASRDEAMEV